MKDNYMLIHIHKTTIENFKKYDLDLDKIDMVFVLKNKTLENPKESELEDENILGVWVQTPIKDSKKYFQSLCELVQGYSYFIKKEQRKKYINDFKAAYKALKSNTIKLEDSVLDNFYSYKL